MKRLIDATANIPRLQECPTHVEWTNERHRKCSICGSTSGTLGIITHSYMCKYKSLNYHGPFVEGSLTIPSQPYESSKTVRILQREYGIISKFSSQHIIGSSSASSCIILCMRNRVTTETILAHIDSMTLEPLKPYASFPPSVCDVYIVGGDNGSKTYVHRLLKELYQQGYSITFAHIIDDTENSFAIHCITGDTYVNTKIHIPVSGDKTKLAFIKTLPFKCTQLQRVNII